MSKKVWVLSSVLAVLAASAAGVGTWYWRNIASLEHGVAYVAPAPASLPAAVSSQPADNALLADALDAFIEDPKLATFGARVADPLNNQVVWEYKSEVPLQPASSTKLLTTLAALKELGPDHRVTTSLLQGPEPSSAILKAGGDVWLTEEKLDRLMEPVLSEKDPEKRIKTLYVDTSVWAGSDWVSGWHPEDVEAGYIAPMQPLMLNKAIVGQPGQIDPPRSSTPAKDVIGRVAERLGVAVKPLAPKPSQSAPVKPAPENPESPEESGQSDPAQPSPENSPQPEQTTAPSALSHVDSPTLRERLHDMVVHSDNVAAEAIGREIAVSRSLPGNSDGAGQAVLDTLSEIGCNTSGTIVRDTSGLSVDNRISPALLGQVIDELVLNPEFRSTIYMLPVAGGTGTLADRYTELSGRGWVRAKTGTLTRTSSLVGVVPAKNGHIYTFALISNGGDVTAQREALDQFTSAIRDF